MFYWPEQNLRVARKMKENSHTFRKGCKDPCAKHNLYSVPGRVLMQLERDKRLPGLKNIYIFSRFMKNIYRCCSF